MYWRYFTCFAFSLSVALVVATSDGPEAAPPESGSARNLPSVYRAGGLPADDSSTPAIRPEPKGDIELQQVLSLTLLHNPELAAFSIEVRAAEARTLQAGLLPNPEVSVEAEDFGGSGPRRGFEGAQTAVRIGQRLELGGKRPKRARVASLDRDLAAWDYISKRADILMEARKAFVDVVAAQERLTLEKELLRLAEQTFETVSARVRAGKVSPVEETRAGVERSNRRIDHGRARRTLDAARKRLAALWGSDVPTFDSAVARIDEVSAVPPAEQFAAEIRGNPDVARWSTEKRRRRAEALLQKAVRIPDLTLAGGVRDFRDTGDSAFVAELSIPLPLFDRNQGGILEARRRVAKADRESAAAQARAYAALAETYHALSVSLAEIDALRTTVTPGAQSAYDAAMEGYRQGKFGYLEVLDAQRTLFEARRRYIEALSAYHKGVAELDRITGTAVDMAGSPSEGK